MIWQSIWVMSVIDLVVIGMIIFTIVYFLRMRHRILLRSTRFGLLAVGLGLVAVAVFHLADFASIHLLPTVLGERLAMAFMNDLHLQYSGFVALISVGSISLGLLVNGRGLVQIVQNLRDSEQRYKKIFDFAPFAIYVQDGKTILEANAAAADIYGHASPEAMVGKCVIDMIHPEDRGRYLERLENFQQHAAQLPFIEERRIRSDGSEINVVQSGIRIPWLGSDLILAMSHDITASKQAEEDLKKRELELEEKSALLQTILDTVPADIVVRDNAGRFTFMNKLASEYYGKPIEDLLGKTTEELLGGNFPAAFGEFVSRIRSSGGLVSEPNYKSVKQPGKTLWLLGAPIAGEDREITGIVSVHLDVTEHKQAEEALHESEQNFRAIAESSPVPLLITRRADGTILYANPQVGPALGLPTEALEGRDIKEFYVRPEERAERIARLETERLVADEVIEMRRDDGTPISTVFSFQFLKYAGEDAILSSFQDVTERLRLENQLRQAQKMEAVGQLTGGVAHDFNNLLAIIIGNLELLERSTALRGQDQEHLHQSLAAAERGASLTHRLLAFARQQPLSPQATSIDAVIEGMQDMLRRTLSEAIEIHFHFHDGQPLMVDKQQLENALLNLAINSRDAMPDGGALTIETSDRIFLDGEIQQGEEITEGKYCLISVTDTGSGMDRDTLNRVFDPFYTTKEFGKGSGLGLSMVQGFVRQSGGHISIYSEVGVGTTVRLYLPLAEVDAGAGTDGKELPEETPPGQGRVVLVVEDDQQLRDTAVEMLQNLGYGVLQAEDAALAMIQLDGDISVDLLFCDVVLPGGVSGPEFVTDAQAKYPDLNVLYCSGYAENALSHDGQLEPGVRCPSSKHLGHMILFHMGGPGSSRFDVKPLVVDGSSGAFGWSVS